MTEHMRPPSPCEVRQTRLKTVPCRNRLSITYSKCLIITVLCAPTSTLHCWYVATETTSASLSENWRGGDSFPFPMPQNGQRKKNYHTLQNAM